ncbi:hypothetical protein A2U01_0097507, partial [Trifolium medium]|nr:hypothetical protein [Trifolium medium]
MVALVRICFGLGLGSSFVLDD